MKNIFILLISALIVFAACEETIELDIDQTQPVYVVEGLVTNEDTTHFVKLSRSIGFYDDSEPPIVSDATVLVKDNEGNTYSYVYSPSDSAYLSTESFQGKTGNIYNLEINVDGNTITATDTLRPVSPIERLQWKIDEEEQEDPEDEGYFYEVTLTAKEPQDTEDFYLFKVYRNGELQIFDEETGVFVTDDVGVGEKIDNYPGPVYYKEEDTATFELYSLTQTSFRFFSDLSFLLNNDGGMFSSIPANPYTNLRGERVVGYFQVSSVTRQSIRVGDPEHQRE